MFIQFEEFEGNLKECEMNLNDADQSKCDAVVAIVKAIELAKTQDIFSIYKSFNAFMVDVEWMFNNCMNIFAGNCLFALFPSNHQYF